MTNSTQKTTIFCRLPSGLTLDLYNVAELKERALSATPVISPPKPIQSVTLNGAKHDPKRRHHALGIAGRTEIDSNFWNEWKKQNPNFSALKNGDIFAAKDNTQGEKMLKERKAEKTGFEPINPEELPHISNLEQD